MIKYIVKHILVILMLTKVFVMPVTGLSQEIDEKQAQEVVINNVDRYFDLAGELAEITDTQFNQIFQYLPSELNPQERNEVRDILEIAQNKIFDEVIIDPEYPAEQWGKVSSGDFVDGGTYEVTWFEGKPVVIVSLDNHAMKHIVVDEGINQKSKHFERFLYNLHVFGGNADDAIKNLANEPAPTTKWGRIKSRLKNTVVGRKLIRGIRRGVDLNIVTVNEARNIFSSKISRRPKWLSKKWWREYWGAQHAGRPITAGKVIKGLGISLLPAYAAYLATGPEMAAVILGFTTVIQIHYDAYFTYKFTNSFGMQILKLGLVSMVTNMAYMGLAYGAELTPELVMDAARNAGYSVILFNEWRLSKKLLDATGQNIGKSKILPGANIKMPKSLVGKKIKVFDKEFVVPEILEIESTKMAKNKIHDTVSDLFPGTGRQAQLVYALPVEFVLGLALLSHGYTQFRYELAKKTVKPEVLNSPKVQAVMDNVFYRKALKNGYQAIKKGCNNAYRAISKSSVAP